jgi:hypothetical protein
MRPECGFLLKNTTKREDIAVIMAVNIALMALSRLRRIFNFHLVFLVNIQIFATHYYNFNIYG